MTMKRDFARCLRKKKTYLLIRHPASITKAVVKGICCRRKRLSDFTKQKRLPGRLTSPGGPIPYEWTDRRGAGFILNLKSWINVRRWLMFISVYKQTATKKIFGGAPETFSFPKTFSFSLWEMLLAFILEMEGGGGGDLIEKRDLHN